MKALITGATGYIGSCLTRVLLLHGHQVMAVSRIKPNLKNVSWVYFDFKSKQSLPDSLNFNVIFHLAANTKSANRADREREIITAKKLIKIAQNKKAKFIFISSQVAQQNAPTQYGQIKWQIEQMVLSAGGYVVRPGQVYGGVESGLFGTLVKIVRKFPILPVFKPDPLVQPIHVEDLSVCLLRLAEDGSLSYGIYKLATNEPVLFSTFLKEIAFSRLHCWRIFFPIPRVLFNLPSEEFNKRSGLNRLNSLFELPVMDTKDDLEKIDIVLKPIRSGMHLSGSDRRRHLLNEGKLLLSYILKETPSYSLMRHYVKAIEMIRDGEDMNLPRVILLHPMFLSLINASFWRDEKKNAEFLWRLDVATMIAESNPMGAGRFINLEQKNLFACYVQILKILFNEIVLRLLRYLIKPLFHFSICEKRDIK